MEAEWVRDLRDRCQATGTAFFFKQWGGRTPKSGGRELDGRTWDEMPLVRGGAVHFQAALAIKAFNMWRLGQETDHIRYKPGGPRQCSDEVPDLDAGSHPRIPAWLGRRSWRQPSARSDARIGNEGHGRLPYERTVQKLFGGWNAGLLAAGYGRLNKDRRPETQAAIEAAVASGETLAAVGERFGVSAAAIAMRLRNRGLRARDLRRAA
jgi:hypothetical protein